jgi:asparagine synthase (glutamine-hydrolysing)
MCGISGYLSGAGPRPDGRRRLETMRHAIRHRGPDGHGEWLSDDLKVGLSHARLSIIDVVTGAQPMLSGSGCVITYNGEIYNYLELRAELGEQDFRTTSDTEVILRAYERWGEACVDHLRGMFAFAIWDPARQSLFIARDRFGIKPLYYIVQDGTFYFASEVKALCPFLPQLRTHLPGLHDYFSFQFCLGDKTMFEGVQQLSPAHCGYLGTDLVPRLRRYWEVHYNLDWDHTEGYFVQRVRERLAESVALHMRSDVEVGAYVSGGVDSSLVAALAQGHQPGLRMQAFTGKFAIGEAFDESRYALALAAQEDLRLHQLDITEEDFVRDIRKVIYHLDSPLAGPGSFAQFMVSGLASRHVKVVLGGQGGDEIFGGYARYLMAYWEQCIKGALDGTMDSGNFVVTYDSIIPNLRTLREYKPLLQEFWAEGFFDMRDKRYFRLINRSNTFGPVVDWGRLGQPNSFDEFKRIFWGDNVQKESYFDSMTHFDFKTLLPALLQVEDRMSMAHGVESRVPFLDHPLVELLATIPANIKFQNGQLKRLLHVAFADRIPSSILERKDKMGFPVPLQLWLRQGGRAREFVLDLFASRRAREREYLAPGFDVEALIARGSVFGRNLWAFLCLELWQQQFHDVHQPFQA